MNNIGIKFKLIMVFILIKVIPLIFISYIAIENVQKINLHFNDNTKNLYSKNQKILISTTNDAINDSIKSLDKKSQESLEKLSVLLANNVAEFLYERDTDILFLSKLKYDDNLQNTIDYFFNSKSKEITTHDDFIYDDNTSKWYNKANSNTKKVKKDRTSILKDNKKEFNYIDPINLNKTNIAIYKEITIIDLNGNEVYKKSLINNNKVNIKNKKNTYITSENYWQDIKKLKKEEIYVSNVIGAYVNSKIIGTFNKKNTKKMNIDFVPEDHAYAGLENPNGKKFDGIIRFVTPLYNNNNKKVAYVSMALDHRHIMEYTDSFNPIDSNVKQGIADASSGNYAFMWDNKARNISHPRDYFIVGYDPKTGKRVPGWISDDLKKEFENSRYKDLNNFLDDHKKFDNQSLNKKPNLAQLKQKGEIALDCRYLNFAPQCNDWMNVTKNGGYGSFVIYWSKVWKLNTAASIPYFTGQYANSKRGFGFVTIGANVKEFHKIASETKNNINNIIINQSSKMKNIINKNENDINNYVINIISKLTIATAFMTLISIIIAVYISNYLTNKIFNIIKGTKEISNNNLDYRLEITSNDEIGELEKSFNKMAEEIQDAIIKISEKDFQIIQQSKMAEIGDMMSSIIHQWKQPLNTISVITTSSQLSMDLENFSNQQMKKSYDDIHRQIKVMNEIITVFSSFFKPGDREDYDILKINKDVLLILSGIYKTNNINLNIKKEVSYIVNGYPSELIQVLINIINNARDAIVEKESKHRNIDIELSKNDNYAVISIQDYAGGISEDVFDDIFDQYKTTKSNKGTGIGLYMSMNIIKKVKGNIEVKNQIKEIDGEEFKGALFTIKLPIN